MKLFDRTKRAKRRALVAQMRRAADCYKSMVAVGESACPHPKPITFVQYAQVLEFVYRNHAERLEELI